MGYILSTFGDLEKIKSTIYMINVLVGYTVTQKLVEKTGVPLRYQL